MIILFKSVLDIPGILPEEKGQMVFLVRMHSLGGLDYQTRCYQPS